MQYIQGKLIDKYTNEASSLSSHPTSVLMIEARSVAVQVVVVVAEWIAAQSVAAVQEAAAQEAVAAREAAKWQQHSSSSAISSSTVAGSSAVAVAAQSGAESSAMAGWQGDLRYARSDARDTHNAHHDTHLIQCCQRLARCRCEVMERESWRESA